MKRFSRLITISAAGFALAAASLFGFSSPAQAHDDAIVTTPTEGSSQEAGVIQLSVTFNEAVMATDSNDGIAFEVIDPAGNTALASPDACLMVSDNEIMSQFEAVEPGTYTVNWRSVSSDGHPVSGSYNFDVTNDNGYEATGANCLMTAMGMGSEKPEVTSEAAASDNSGLWGLGTGVALLAAIAVGASIFVKRKKKA